MKVTHEQYFEGIGRRKSASARVRMFKGKEASVVNSKPIEEYFTVDKANTALEPLKVVDLDGQYYITVLVEGGGITGQVDAIKLGLARALYKMDETLKPALRTHGMVTRDPRKVERKKYGFRKARKKPQFSKR